MSALQTTEILQEISDNSKLSCIFDLAMSPTGYLVAYFLKSSFSHSFWITSNISQKDKFFQR